jgi:oligopeptide transport system substrate-binding protein
MSNKWYLLLLCVVFAVTGCTKKSNLKEKVLSVTVTSKVKGFDPVNAGDTYSSGEIARVYEGLLQYHYLKRPYELMPNLAEAMPEVSNNGMTYTFKIKKGVLFHDNKCFPNGKGRELKASDFVYSIKRLADPKNTSTGWWLLDGKIKGLNEWRDLAAKSDKSDYSLEVEGLKALDDYTLQFTLSKAFPQFLYSLAMVYTYAVPKEAVDMYGKEFINNPVGTGPFMTSTYTQSTRIEYKKNPNFRDVRYPTEGAPGDKEAGLLKDAGKKLPLVEKIIVNIQTESQPAWLAFEKGKTDYFGIPKDQFDSVVTPDKGITDSYAKKGITMEVTPDLDITYIAFNHEDKLFQGKKGLLLRRAMALAYDVNESNKLFYNDRGIPAQTILPPGIGGYDKDYKNPYAKFDLAKAKELLAQAGYEGGKGIPEINYETTASTISRQMSEFFKKSMAKIGINVKVNTNTWPELTKKVHNRQAQMFGMAWLGDYPDGENFLQLLYGPNSAPGPNGSNYNNAEFNKTFAKASIMQDSPERNAMYAKLAQGASEDVAYIFGIHRTSFVVKHGWLKNYKFSTFSHGSSKYLDIDLKKKKELLDKL